MTPKKPLHAVRLDSLGAGQKFTGPGNVVGRVVQSLPEGVVVEIRRRDGGKGESRVKLARSTWMGATMVERA